MKTFSTASARRGGSGTGSTPTTFCFWRPGGWAKLPSCTGSATGPSRNEELGPPDDRLAIELLDAVAKNPEGESAENLKLMLSKHFRNSAERDDRVRYLLDVLQADGYLVEIGGRFLFRSSLLRDFWPRR